MGFKISWIGFESKDKAAVLDLVGLKDTGEPDVVNETAFSGAAIPHGWFILFSNDFQFVSRERLAPLSIDCRIVGCQVHEGIMFSAAYGFERGNCLWELSHDAQHGTNNLLALGSPPRSFHSIRERLTQRQAETAGGGVDYIFDIPVEVAASICNYRYGRLKFDWGMPKFTRLEAL